MRRVFILLALAALAATARTQTVDRGAPATRLAGNWQVSYEDLALGEIDGTATITPDGLHATVVLKTGVSGPTYTLQSDSITEQGEDYTIVLIGDSPSAPGLLPDDKVQHQAFEAQAEAANVVLATYGGTTTVIAKAMPSPAVATFVPVPTLGDKYDWAVGQHTRPPDVHLKVSAGASQVGLEVADYKATLPLKPTHAVETRRVVLTLHFTPTSDKAGYSGPAGDLLSGTWRFFADPIRMRDGEDKGRVGYFRRDAQNPNLTTQSAAEVWFRPNPPAQLKFFAVGVFGLVKLTNLYPGVPTIVEAIFDSPQDFDTCPVEVKVGDQKLTLTAHRDIENARRYVTDPFLPGTDNRPSPPPSARPAPAADSPDPNEMGP